MRLITLMTSSLLVSLSAFAIRGGVPVRDSLYAGVGMLEPACTATLITPDTIITAAHCVRQAATVDNLKFHYTDSSGQERVLKALPMKSPMLMATLPSQELALVRLEAPARVNQFAKISLPAVSTAAKQGIIIGYGASERAISSSVKLAGRVQISPARVSLGSFLNIPMLRTTPVDKSSNNIACQGDSGGPLFSGGRLLGIVSGYYEADENFLAQGVTDQCRLTPWVYYVPIAPYYNWIKTALIQLGSKAN